MTDIAILGGRGMLGGELADLAKSEGLSVSVLDLPEFDMTAPDAIEEAAASSKIIVNCAAYTNVDKAETEREKCSLVNSVAAGRLAEAAKSSEKHLIHISTDFVFPGEGESPLGEDSPVRPLSHYGLSKLEGERLVLSSGCQSTILRIEWTYGRHGVNFASKIAGLARSRDSIRVVDDQVGSPTHTLEVARAILCLARTKAEGIFHFSAANFASRFEVAKFIVAGLGLKTQISPCSSEEFPSPAKRPKNSRFDCSKIDRILDFRREDWRVPLAKFIECNCRNGGVSGTAGAK